MIQLYASMQFLLCVQLVAFRHFSNIFGSTFVGNGSESERERDRNRRMCKWNKRNNERAHERGWAEKEKWMSDLCKYPNVFSVPKSSWCIFIDKTSSLSKRPEVHETSERKWNWLKMKRKMPFLASTASQPFWNRCPILNGEHCVVCISKLLVNCFQLSWGCELFCLYSATTIDMPYKNCLTCLIVRPISRY